MSALEQELRETHAMSLAEYDVLHHQAQARGRRLRMRALSQAVLYTTSGMTRLLDRMVEAGLVDREPSPSDRRGMYAVLTRWGLSLLRKASATHLAGVQRYFARYSCPGTARALQLKQEWRLRVLRASTKSLVTWKPGTADVRWLRSCPGSVRRIT
ncbi:MarR family winged helix-turn-helix transcriptional regulator [Streptomyces sp. LN785]|uniref:MarR family winged helix-turn-helix transcriptional regulator n=1 Tax=Streptomyces sp. LN785 TaxID=3112983 RepID=UPI003716639A